MDYQSLPRCRELYIMLELEKLNTETAEINKLELELEEAYTTFRMLLNEATRRLKGLAQRLGNTVDRARPYYDALTAAQDARAACQRAAVAYQRASEIHAAAKETVALAEQRFKSNQHEWQFDSAWQEMLNHATMKVMDAENQKSECGREHHKRAQLFNTAETKLQQLEEQLRKHVIKSRPYFDEKQLCQEQLATQKERINYLQSLVSKAKYRYSQSLKTLEAISEEIHMKRRDLYDDNNSEYPVGPREPGVGAENYNDYSLELEMNDLALREKPIDDANMDDDTETLEELRRRVRRLAARPVVGGERGDIAWETELNETVNRLDQMLLMRERAQQAKAREQNRFSPMPCKYTPAPFNSNTGIDYEEKPSTSTEPKELNKHELAEKFSVKDETDSYISSISDNIGSLHSESYDTSKTEYDDRESSSDVTQAETVSLQGSVSQEVSNATVEPFPSEIENEKVDEQSVQQDNFQIEEIKENIVLEKTTDEIINITNQNTVAPQTEIILTVQNIVETIDRTPSEPEKIEDVSLDLASSSQFNFDFKLLPYTIVFEEEASNKDIKDSNFDNDQKQNYNNHIETDGFIMNTSLSNIDDNEKKNCSIDSSVKIGNETISESQSRDNDNSTIIDNESVNKNVILKINDDNIK